MIVSFPRPLTSWLLIPLGLLLVGGLAGSLRPAAAAGAATREDQLEKGSLVTVRTRRPTAVGKILKAVEQTTGNRITVVDKFGRENEAALNRRIEVSITTQPFWKAVQMIEEASNTRFSSLEDGALELEPASGDSQGFQWFDSAGPPTVAGAFLLLPGFDTASEKHIISVRPEPSLGTPQFVKGRITPASREQQKLFTVVGDLSSRIRASTGELTIGFSLKSNVRHGGRGGREQPAEVDMKLEAELLFPADQQDVKLPSLKYLLAKTKRRPLKVGTLLLRVTKAGKEKGFMGFGDDFAVTLQVVEGNLNPKDIKLLDAAGTYVEAVGTATERSNDVVKVTRSFSLEKTTGNPLNCRLVLHIPTEVKPYRLKATIKGVRVAPQ